MSQDNLSHPDRLGKALESARKGGQRAARKLTGKHSLLSLAMLDQGSKNKPAIDRAFVQHGVCL